MILAKDCDGSNKESSSDAESSASEHEDGISKQVAR